MVKPLYSSDEMNMLAVAIITATTYHVEQVDKLGKPYIDHPLRVMMAVQSLDEKIVAVLHDTIEDTELTYDNLRNLGFPEYIIEAIDCITKRDKGKMPETNYDYIERVKTNKIATAVKLADLADNRSPSRLIGLDEKTQQRLIEKYDKAFLQIKGG